MTTVDVDCPVAPLLNLAHRMMRPRTQVSTQKMMTEMKDARPSHHNLREELQELHEVRVRSSTATEHCRQHSAKGDTHSTPKVPLDFLSGARVTLQQDR